MSENVKKWIEYVKNNKEVLEKLKTFKTKEEMLEYAKEKGFTFTDEELNMKLTKEELNEVTGGWGMFGPCYEYFTMQVM